MRYFFLLPILTVFLNSCSEQESKAQNIQQEYDIQPFLVELDSLGYDIENDTLLFSIGRQNNYYGRDDKGNALIKYALSKRENITAEDYHEWSVQNTKNGNYAIAIDKLEKAMELNPKEVSPYYGWVLLYYYRDYKKALTVLEQCDAFTPNFSDAPMGEDIHYLKGLCYMQMNNYQKANAEFDNYINNLTSTHGEDFVDVYTFVQKGRCLTELKHFEEAIESYNKAIKHYKNCTEAYYFKGLTQLKNNQKELACKNFNIALDLIQKRL